ncbi:hypothetical protein [Shewanella sp. CG_4_10_14_0_8_um_filter_42_13]|uniref:hypothetical protein n=1 Tax=Shewanella sp. CG_4_10_14_0_8_um_filter_42_13 TaxID=1975534 RepID=UPI000CC9E6DD|nr:hypothetical protein [Shewanella sp. CG_4_10_14_0_8_um_filter_42_13]PIY67393.1 MAG: hypothetical protein COY92_05785 [Shewanella sp. CG_4_10_14_0_8_um_filter_42_13]
MDILKNLILGFVFGLVLIWVWYDPVPEVTPEPITLAQCYVWDIDGGTITVNVDNDRIYRETVHYIGQPNTIEECRP